MNFVEELRWRGMIADMMPGTEEQLQKELALISIFQRYFQKIRLVLLNRKRQQDERSLWLEMV